MDSLTEKHFDFVCLFHLFGCGFLFFFHFLFSSNHNDLGMCMGLHACTQFFRILFRKVLYDPGCQPPVDTVSSFTFAMGNKGTHLRYWGEGGI